jgi:hypothetical protein
MRIFDKSDLNEARKMNDGTVGIFEYVDGGHCHQDRFMVYEGELFFEMDSCYHDAKTGAPLDCFYRYDEDDNMVIAIRSLDGSIDIDF